MHQLIPSLVNGTLDEACEKLAEVAVAAREKSAIDWGGLGESLRSQAGQLSDSLQSHASNLYQHAQPHLQHAMGLAGDFASAHPVGAGALAGAGLGAAYGGLTSLGRDPEERQTGHNMFTGALAGAGVGIGAGLLHQHLPPLLEHFSTPETPAAPAAGQSSLPEGEFMHNGQRRRIIPETPGLEELNARLQHAESPSVPEAALNAASNFMGGYAEKHPWLARLMLADAAGTGLGGLAQMRNPSGSLNPRDLAAGLPETISNLGDSHPATKYLRTLQNAPAGRLQEAGIRARSGPGKGGYSATTNDAVQKAIAQGTPALGRRPSPAALADLFRGARPQPMPGPAATRLGRFGQGLANMSGRASAAIERLPGPRTLPQRLAARAGVYGGIPMVQWLLDHYHRQLAEKQQLENAVRQYSEPVR